MFFDGKVFVLNGIHDEPMHLREGYLPCGMSGSFSTAVRMKLGWRPAKANRRPSPPADVRDACLTPRA
jgi:hypothetical protein